MLPPASVRHAPLPPLSPTSIIQSNELVSRSCSNKIATLIFDANIFSSGPTHCPRAHSFTSNRAIVIISPYLWFSNSNDAMHMAGPGHCYERHFNEGAIPPLCVDQFIEMLQFHFVRSVTRSAKPKTLICHLQNSWISAKSGQAEQDLYNEKSRSPMFSIGCFSFSTFYPWTKSVLLCFGKNGPAIQVGDTDEMSFTFAPTFYLFFSGVTNRKGLGCLVGLRSVGLVGRFGEGGGA